MPNPFSINVITPAGAALIARATATNQIVFSSALSGTTAATDATDLAGKTAAFYDGAAGTIAASSATGEVARIVAQFGNASGPSAQPVKSVCILGRLASQNDTDAVIVAAMSDADSPIVLPASTSPEQVFWFPFNLSIETAEDVTTAYSAGATIADLARFVSMHKAGDPTAGEDQTILGAKNFSGDVAVNGSLAVLGDSSMDTNNAAYLSQYTTGGALTLMLSWPDLAADSAELYVDGDLRCSGTLQAGNATLSSLIASSLLVGGSVYIDGANGVVTDQIQGSSEGNYTISVNATLYPVSAPSPYDLGKSDAAWGHVYASHLHGFPEALANGGGVSPTDPQTLDVQVGNVLLAAFIPNSVGLSGGARIGEAFTLSAPVSDATAAVYARPSGSAQGVFGPGGERLPAGTYKLLSSFSMGSDLYSVVALVIRTA